MCGNNNYNITNNNPFTSSIRYYSDPVTQSIRCTSKPTPAGQFHIWEQTFGGILSSDSL